MLDWYDLLLLNIRSFFREGGVIFQGGIQMTKNRYRLNFVITCISCLIILIPVTSSLSLAQEQSSPATTKAVTGGTTGISKAAAAGEAGEGGTVGVSKVSGGEAGAGATAGMSTAEIVGISAAVVSAAGVVAVAINDDDSSSTSTAAHHHK